MPIGRIHIRTTNVKRGRDLLAVNSESGQPLHFGRPIKNKNDMEIIGRHFRTQTPLHLRWEHGLLTHLETVTVSKPSEVPWLAPGLVDVQVNGYGGIDFQQPTLSRESLFQAVRALRRDGCTRFLLTLVTQEWHSLLEQVARVRQIRESSPELQHAILGFHVEGPFLSDQPGYRGAHDAALMLDPTPERIQMLHEAVHGLPTLLTLAPERPRSLEAIAHAVSLGMRVNLGHTDASSEILREAVHRGATGLTHLGNACPQKLDRHDNILWRMLELPQVIAGIIPDGIHVSPALFRIFHRAMNPQRIYYSTDAMAAAGASSGHYTIGSLAVEVGADGIVRQPGQENYAGSALSPFEGIRRASEMLRVSWTEVWQRFSEIPAAMIGATAKLEVGAPADFCVLEESERLGLQLREVYARGQQTSPGASPS